MKTTWILRKLCQCTVQSFWLGRCELKDVLGVYQITKEDRCHDTVAKLLMKTKKDFVNGFSFFTREDIDKKIVTIMTNTHCNCINEN